MATPVTTVSTAKMTGLVNTRPSQQRSTRHTNGMMSSLATCLPERPAWRTRRSQQRSDRQTNDKLSS